MLKREKYGDFSVLLFFGNKNYPPPNVFAFTNNALKSSLLSCHLEIKHRSKIKPLSLLKYKM